MSQLFLRCGTELTEQTKPSQKHTPIQSLFLPLVPVHERNPVCRPIVENRIITEQTNFMEEENEIYVEMH